jgi:hypothetical protein
MSLLNFSSPFLATPNPPSANFFPPPVPYSYPTPQKPFLREDYGGLHQGHQGQLPATQFQHNQQQPAYTKVTDDGTKTKVHAVIDYDYDEDEAPGLPPPVTPIQGPIYIKNGSVPVVPLYSHPVLNNGTFVQIPVSTRTFRRNSKGLSPLQALNVQIFFHKNAKNPTNLAFTRIYKFTYFSCK